MSAEMSLIWHYILDLNFVVKYANRW